MKQRIALLLGVGGMAVALVSCAVMPSQEMVNADGKRFACSGAGGSELGLFTSAQTAECMAANRQRGWLPAHEVGELPIRFQPRDGLIFVADVLPGFPSPGSITPTDQLVAIDGQPVLSWEDARERLFGAKGTPIQLTLQSAQGELEVDLVRQ